MEQWNRQRIERFFNEQDWPALLGHLEPKININRDGLRDLVSVVQERLTHPTCDRGFAAKVLRAISKNDKADSEAKWKALAALLREQIDVNGELFTETLARLKADQLERYALKHIKPDDVLPYWLDLYPSKRHDVEYQWLRDLLPVVANAINHPKRLDKDTSDKLVAYLHKLVSDFQGGLNLLREADLALISLALKSKNPSFRESLVEISNLLSEKGNR